MLHSHILSFSYLFAQKHSQKWQSATYLFDLLKNHLSILSIYQISFLLMLNISFNKSTDERHAFLNY